MGNIFAKCIGKGGYIAKDTFKPTEDVFHHIEQDDKDPDAEKKTQQLKTEKPLAFTTDDKLKMIKEDTELLGPGGTKLYKMKNLKTGEVGLILADSVAKQGTVECEK